MLWFNYFVSGYMERSQEPWIVFPGVRMDFCGSFPTLCGQTLLYASTTFIHLFPANKSQFHPRQKHTQPQMRWSLFQPLLQMWVARWHSPGKKIEVEIFPIKCLLSVRKRDSQDWQQSLILLPPDLEIVTMHGAGVYFLPPRGTEHGREKDLRESDPDPTNQC